MPTLREILTAPKRATSHRPGKSKASPSHEAHDVAIETEADGRLHVFIRVNRAIPESFSVGLVYSAEGLRDRILVRVNGDHGSSHRNPDGTLLANTSHIHGHPEARQDWDVSQLGLEAKHAAPVESPLTLPRAWEILCAAVNIVDDAGVSRLLWHLHATLAMQISMEFDQ